MTSAVHRNWLYWTPRVLGIAAILFISIFALDAFEEGRSLWENLLAFLMHLIPSFVLILLLVIAWNRELIGGIIFTAIGAIMSPVIFSHNYAMNQSVGLSLLIVLMITFPFIVIGVLFILNHYRNKKLQHR